MDVPSVMVGFVSGVLVAAAFVLVMLQLVNPKGKAAIPRGARSLVAILSAFAALSGAQFAHAQTPVPVPTLNIPVAQLFGQTNFWMGTFAPVVAIGVGITIALAVLGYVGLMIASAFRH